MGIGYCKMAGVRWGLPAAAVGGLAGRQGAEKPSPAEWSAFGG